MAILCMHAAFTFPPTLTNHDRAVVHMLCRKYGLKSKSNGCATHRFLCFTQERVTCIATLRPFARRFPAVCTSLGSTASTDLVAQSISV
jgi:hypothetical protein